MDRVTLCPLKGMGTIYAESNLCEELIRALEREEISLQNGDILVVAHKVVSKAEGRELPLVGVIAGPEARRLADLTGKSPQLCQLVLDESEEVVAAQRGILMARHHLGWTCANAGVDQSNTTAADSAVLLPKDPDASARAISQHLEERFGVKVAVLVSDTHGRPLREGIVGVVVGCWGIRPLRSYVGSADRSGREMRASVEAVADEIAAAASLLMGQGAESIPAVLVRGLDLPFEECGSDSLKRGKEREVFCPRGEGV